MVLASMLWGPGWQGESIVVHCDNLAVVEVVNAGYSKDPLLMQMLRCLFFIIAHHNFSLRATHIQGRLNVGADAVIVFLAGTQGKQATHCDTRGISSLGDQKATRLLSRDWSQLFKTCLQQASLPARGKCMEQAPADTGTSAP